MSTPTDKIQIEAPHPNSRRALPSKFEQEIRSGNSFPMESINKCFLFKSKWKNDMNMFPVQIKMENLLP